MSKFDYKQLEKDKNKFKFEVKTTKEAFDEEYETIFKEESKNVKIAGFRPGMAPRAEIEKRIASDVLNKTVNSLLPKITFEILVQENINPISGVQYDLKNINADSSIDYEFTVVNSPEINVSELAKIKVEHKAEEVKDEEIEMVIRNIIQTTLPEADWKKPREKKEGEEEPANANDFEVTDELVKKLGYEEETTYEGLKAKVRETLARVKEEQSENEYAQKVLKEAVKVADFIIPEDMVEDEVHHREHHFIERLENLKLDADSYLKTQNKTMEDVKNEWREEIKQTAGVDILAINLAKQEKLVPTEEEIEAEIEQIEDEITKIRYKSDEGLRDQMRTVLTRNKGVKKLVDLTKENK